MTINKICDLVGHEWEFSYMVYSVMARCTVCLYSYLYYKNKGIWAGYKFDKEHRHREVVDESLVPYEVRLGIKETQT